MASISKTDIVNAALRELGAKRVSSIDDNLPRAKVIKDLYDVIRRQMFEDGRYQFAMKRSALTEKADAPAFGYEREYELPAGFIAIFEESDGYEIVLEGDGILSDESQVHLIYIWDNEDVAQYSAAFVKAFYLSLAAASAYDITGSVNKGMNLARRAEQAALIAMGSSSRQGDRTSVVKPTSLINARRK